MKLSSEAYPASNSAVPIGSGMPAAARFAAPRSSSRCRAVVSVVLWWVPMAKMTCRRPARACRLYSWSKPPFFSGMTRLARSVVFALAGRAGAGGTAGAAIASSSLRAARAAAAAAARTSRCRSAGQGARPPLPPAGARRPPPRRAGRSGPPWPGPWPAPRRPGPPAGPSPPPAWRSCPPAPPRPAPGGPGLRASSFACAALRRASLPAVRFGPPRPASRPGRRARHPR